MSEGLNREPFVVIVDDHDQTAFADLIREYDVRATFFYPDDLNEDALADATTIVLDQYLVEWPGRDDRDLPTALKVADGLALSAVLRSQIEGSARDGTTRINPVAFVLRTGELDRIAFGFPRQAREHLLAAQHNLEWVFDKNETSSDLPSVARRVASLALAVSTLPDDWKGDPIDFTANWLRLGAVDWREDALWQIEQCRPPRHVLAKKTGGEAWIKWFLHKILPFPTFLLDKLRVALLLGVPAEEFDGIVASDSPLASQISKTAYTGPMSEFLGQRWWRAGIGSLIEGAAGDNESGIVELADVRTGLEALHGASIEFLEIEHPILRTRADYGTFPEPIDLNDAIRLQPDGWPPYADEVWAARSDIDDEDSNQELRNLVVFADRWLVGERRELG